MYEVWVLCGDLSALLWERYKTRREADRAAGVLSRNGYYSVWVEDGR